MRLVAAAILIGALAACASNGGTLAAPLATAAPSGPNDATPPGPRPAEPPAPDPRSLPSASVTDEGAHCAPGTCSGVATEDLIAFATRRAASSRACYDQALTSDPTVRGTMEIQVRLTETGSVCEARVTRTTMPPDVSECVRRVLGGTAYPSPRNGCLDVTIPLAFVPRSVDAGVP